MTPATAAELADAVRSAPRVIAVGAGTKPRLAQVGDEFVRISTAKLAGIVEYEPSEFTFTALAGTPLQVIVAALAERGQYLPFDPVLARAGATLGGTVAAGLSGPGRFRFGGLRDFILGVQFVDGEGRLLRLGGKVVKNAAGFDLPKFFVGSAGRFGALAEITFKVFPRPAARRTLRLEAKDFAAKVKLFTELAVGRWEVDALDAALEEPAVFARLGGPPEALDVLAKEILARWTGTTLTGGEADYFWQTVAEFRWAHSNGTLIKFALTPGQVEAFATCLRGHSGARGWVSAGGNAGYASFGPGAARPELAWPGVTLRGEGPLWLGARAEAEVMQAVKRALDPTGRFPELNS
ncbi:MAG TPA: FAD-binding protein [Opitutaceae bacterium]|nr:FAD-binding protein [Opitutaceae bacterium]